ncbi:MAG: phosphoglucosamine mutase [Alphaproteobacteria bacterium]|nr:phosphoglucosamine mutase [Alphaproteobacteria bacterium]
MSTERKLFGTDGIRGRSNEEPMTATTALRVAMATAQFFRRGEHRHRVVIGKDTRLSGYMLEPALTAGFIAQGMDVILLGPIPTPAVALLTKSLRADLGVMISASHNPYEDNGIKLFGPDGRKLSDAIELQIEALMDEDVTLVDSSALGKAARLEDALGRYVEFVKMTFPHGLRLDGLKIAIDCANGAAYKVAPSVLWELGAEVIPLGVEPNGRNINRKCGATDIGLLRESVLLHGADVGIALDGDADRLMMVDEKGQVIDGDQMMALIALEWKEKGRLKEQGLVATVMSNLGLERFLNQHDLKLFRTNVGDRYVLQAMQEYGYNFGGEQSGHMIFNDYSTTGDGLLAALQVLAVICRRGQPASTVCRLFEPVPQRMKSIYTTKDVLNDPAFQKAVKAAEKALDGTGRLLVRKSGTEALIRIMAEGDDEALVEKQVDDLAALAEKI